MILHLVNASEAIGKALDCAASDDALLLIEKAVLAVDDATMLSRLISAHLSPQHLVVYVLMEDLIHHHVALPEAPLHCIDMPAWVILTESVDKIVTWNLA